MTTVVFRDGVLAFDCARWQGDWQSGNDTRKAVRLRDGSLLAVTGNLLTLQPWREWFNAECVGDRPSDKDATIVHIKKNGVLTLYEENGVINVPKSPFYVFGSGMPPARGALMAGATAIEAVRIACRIDPWSVGPIRSLKL